jgi:hypothetical protein
MNPNNIGYWSFEDVTNGFAGNFYPDTEDYEGELRNSMEHPL